MNKYAKRYFIDALSGMAQGLFASLLIGTIIRTLGRSFFVLQTLLSFIFLSMPALLLAMLMLWERLWQLP